MIVFIDVETSAFSGFPVEVGWAKADLSDGWSAITQPTAKWVQTYPWDRQSEHLHGLIWRKLMNKGLPPKEVAERLNTDLADAEVYSDAPGYDGKWLALLFETAEIQQGFVVKDATDFLKNTAMSQKTFPIGYGDITWNLFLKAGGTEHRALDDACLQALHVGAIEMLATADVSRDILIEKMKALINTQGRN
jgi:hypothetical protein